MNDSVRNEANTPPRQAAESNSNPVAMGAESAGALLRAARETSGLHIAALAAALKVPVRKLEALEANRWEELTDATFTRALASSVARHLKADPAAVLAALPSHGPVPLVISDGLGKAAPDHQLRSAQHIKPLVWGVAALLVASVGMYFSPMLWPDEGAQPGSETTAAVLDAVPATPLQLPDATVVPTASNASVGLPDPAVSMASPAIAAADPPAQPAPLAQNTQAVASANGLQPLLVVKADRDTWLEATDSNGRLRIQRVLKAGEEVSFADASTLAVVIGNAAGAQATVKGQPLDLLAVSKNNIARFEVK